MNYIVKNMNTISTIDTERSIEIRIENRNEIIRLTDRDLKVLRWIGEQYAVRVDTLQKILGSLADETKYFSEQKERTEGGPLGERNTRRIVERWKKLELVKTRKPLTKEPYYVWLTQKGINEFELGFREWTPTIGKLKHFHAINEVRFYLEQRHLDRMEWKSERQLRSEWGNIAKREGTTDHTADAEIIYDHKFKIGLEVDITRKAKQRLHGIIYTLNRSYDGLWYFVNNETQPVVMEAIQTVMTNPQARDRFRVYNIEQNYVRQYFS
jgi:hypothetical protein